MKPCKTRLVFAALELEQSVRAQRALGLRDRHASCTHRWTTAKSLRHATASPVVRKTGRAHTESPVTGSTRTSAAPTLTPVAAVLTQKKQWPPTPPPRTTQKLLDKEREKHRASKRAAKLAADQAKGLKQALDTEKQKTAAAEERARQFEVALFEERARSAKARPPSSARNA